MIEHTQQPQQPSRPDTRPKARDGFARKAALAAIGGAFAGFFRGVASWVRDHVTGGHDA